MYSMAVSTLALLLSIALPASLPAEAIPQQFHSPVSESPIWLSASEMVTPDGEVRWDLLESQTWGALYRDLFEKGNGCVEVGPTEILAMPGYPSDRTLEDLSVNASGIFEGMVTGIDYGFYVGQAGAVLQVEVEQTLRTSELYTSDPYLYVFYPKGDFKLGPYSLCARDPELPPLPQLGQSILVFDFTSPIDTSGRFLAPLRTPVFTQGKDGKLLAPVQWQADVAEHRLSSLSGLVSLSRSLVDPPK